jgi:hypothetical protein
MTCHRNPRGKKDREGVPVNKAISLVFSGCGVCAVNSSSSNVLYNSSGVRSTILSP